jgi:hypothetical protein
LIQAEATLGAGGTVTNSYGLTVNTQTGATNNYAAAFLGGNVGIGTTAPTAALHLTKSTGSGAQLPLFLAVGAAHTALTATFESPDINLDLSATKQWATGALTTQRAMLIQAPTYGFVGASTITDAYTLSINAAPIAGTNATITRSWAFAVQAGNTQLAGSTYLGAEGIAPTAFAHIAAGTATASTAPLKFTAGTALTSAEAGAMEFSNSETGLTFTAVATRRAFVLDTATQTVTNKRVTRRLTTTNAPGATPTTNTDNVDVMNFTGLAAAITSMTTNLSGTPVDGDQIEFRFTDNGTARAITWGASFGATTVPLPTTTVISTMLRVGFEWNGSIWQCVAVA